MPNSVQPVRLPSLMQAALAAAIVLSTAGVSLPGAETKTNQVDISKLPPSTGKKVDFAKEIQPLFKEACLDCHGKETQMGKFRLDQKEAALKGGESGPAIIPGKSAQSPLIHFVARLVKDKEMPPGDPLTKEQVGLLRAWIDQGANW